MYAVWGFALAAAVVFGLLRHQADFLCDYDTRFWFVGGRCWLGGESPYDLEAFLAAWTSAFGDGPVFRASFVYPGAVLPVALGLGAMSWDAARWTMRAANVALLVGSMLLMRRMARDRGGTVPRGRDAWAGAAALVPGVALTLFQGQLSLFATFGLCGAWWGLSRGKTIWFAAGLYLASIKPQLTALPIVFLLVLHGSVRTWIVAGLVAASHALVTLWSGPSRLFTELRGSLAEHAAQEFNRPDNYDSLVAHLPGLAASHGLQRAGLILGIALAVAMGMRARVRPPALPHVEERWMQLALVATGVFMPIHRYDLAIHVPLVASLWALVGRTRAAVMFVLVLLHGGASTVCWHIEARTGIACDYHLGAAVLAVFELVLLGVFWHRDSVRRSAGMLPAGADR
ncbi:MAG: DUF2029 domain-containing protein [Planctomycetes bacterium]|nr:DUF2029 domain-containing protein [Planctomycetota bacterium]